MTITNERTNPMKPDVKRLGSITDEMMFTLAEAAAMCGVTAAGVRNWSIKDKIKLIRIGSRFYVTGAELKRAIEV